MLLSLAHLLHANCVAVRATCRKQQTPKLQMEGTVGVGGGGGSGRGLCTVFCSPKLPLFRTVSQQFYRLLYFISGEFPLLFFFFFPDR